MGVCIGNINSNSQTFREGNGTPLQHSCLENPMDGEAWWAAVHGVTKSRTRLSNFPYTFHFPLSWIGEGNGNPLQCSCLENPRDGEAWWAAIYEVAQSQPRLKPLSSSSSSKLLESFVDPLKQLINAVKLSPGNKSVNVYTWKNLHAFYLFTNF